MAGGSADIGIRVFLDDAASQALGSINGALGRMVSTTGQASRAMGGLSGAMAAVGVAVGFAAVLLAFGAAIKYSVDQASLFQQAMFSVAVATHVPMDTALQYSGILMNLAASSTYTSTEIANGIVQMGRAGFTIHDIFTQMAQSGAGFVNVGGRMVPIMASMAQAGIALGIATRSTAVQGFTLLTQAMVAYQAPANEALHYANLLQFGFEHQRGSVSDFTSALSQVLPQAAQFHVGLREVIAALDTFGPAMASSSRAGTALRYAMTGLYSPTAGAQKEMVALGLASVDASGKFHSAFYDNRGAPVDFATAIHILNDKLKGMNQEARNDALHKLFSIKGGQGVADLLQMIQRLDNYLSQLKNSADNSGGAMKRWDEVMKTLGGATAGLKSSITDLAVVLGNMFLPALTKIATQANGFVTSIRTMASANPGAIGSFLKLGAAMSGIGLIATIVIMVIAGVGTGILAFIGIVAGVAVGVVALTIGIMMLANWFRNLYASSSTVRSILSALGSAFNDIATAVQGSINSALAFLRSNLTQLGPVLSQLGGELRDMLPIFGLIAAFIVGTLIGSIKGLLLALVTFITGLAMVAAGIIMIFTGLVQIIRGFLMVLVGLITLNREMVLQGLSKMGQGALNVLQGAFTAIAGIVIATLGSVIAFIVGFVSGIINWFQHLSSVLVGASIVPTMMNAIRNAIMNGLNAVIGFISGWVGRIISFFANLASQAVARVTLAFNLIRTAIQISLILAQAAVMLFVAQVQARISAMGAAISSAVSSAWNFIRSTITSAAASIVSTVLSMGARVIAAVTSAFNTARSVAASALASIVGVVSSGFNTVVSRVQSAGASILSSMQTAWDRAKSAASNGINSIVSLAAGLPKRVVDAISGLANMLYNSGRNAMQSFASGLSSALGSVVDAVAAAASKVASFLHHSSPPTVGPLAGDDQWMPHMMQMMATGVDTHAPLIKDAMNRALSGISSVPQMTRIGGPSIAPTVVAGGGGGGSKVVQLVVNGRILGQAVMDDWTTQLQLNGGGRAFR